METRIALRYTGPSVDSGLMDVYEASANMIAFSDFVGEISRQVFGGTVQTTSEVAGFGRGSFVTDLVFRVAGASSSIFAAVDPTSLLQVLKESFVVWKFLKGRPPSRVVRQNATAVVTNNYGEVKQFSAQCINVVFSDKGSEAAQQFVQKALEKAGMDAIEIATESGLIASASQAESSYFVPVAPSETVTDTTVVMSLVLESPVFKEDNKWRFYDGQQSFYANMADRSFLARVDSGEPFRKGDIVRAEVRISQERSGMKLTAERTIVKVLDHREGQQQLQADLGDSENSSGRAD